MFEYSLAVGHLQNTLTISRLLGSITANCTETTESDGHHPELTDSLLLRYTLRLYGTAFCVMFCTFLVLRKHCPRTFNVRSWAPNIQCDLAHEALTWGYLEWMWKVYWIPDDDFREQCGLDALCYLRALRFGVRVSCVGIFNSIWLLAVYGTSEESTETKGITDKIVEVTVSNVPSGSYRFFGTVIASYIFFLAVMNQILREFEWFTDQRQKFLSRPVARNYSLYVTGIPPAYRSSHHLKQFFQKVFNADDILEAHVALRIPQLTKKVAQREGLAKKIEHLYNIAVTKGKRPTQQTLTIGNDGVNDVDAIEVNEEELSRLNDEITKAIDDWERSKRSRLMQDLQEMHKHPSCLRNVSTLMGSDDCEESEDRGPDNSLEEGVLRPRPGLKTKGLFYGEPTMDEDESGLTALSSKLIKKDDGDDNDTFVSNGGSTRSLFKTQPLKQVRSTVSYTARTTVKVAGTGVTQGAKKVNKTAKKAVTVASNVTSNAVSRVIGDNEGEPLNSGFVTFKKLSTAQAALQMVHHPQPFVMKTQEAPDAHDIFWSNVGRPIQSVHIGKLISLGCTVALCLFWTLPVSFIASLTEVDTLKHNFSSIETLIGNAPWMEDLLALIAPILILTLTLVVLPEILQYISTFEGPISKSVLEATVFVKMAAFMVSIF